MEKLNYYADDINMIYQATSQKSGEALKNLSESLSSSFAIANENINNSLKQFGITGKTLYEVLSQIADKWVDVSLAEYTGKDDLSVSETDEETDKSNEKSDLEIFGEKLESEIFSESNQPHTTTISFGPPMTIKADNTNNEFIIF